MNNISGYIQPNSIPVREMNNGSMNYMPDNRGTYSMSDDVKRNSIMIVSILLIIIIIIIIYMIIKYKDTKKSSTGTSTFESFQNIDKLTECGWEVYVTDTCPYCIKQKDILTQYFPKFDKIYTDKPANAVPTWYNVNTKETKVGLQSYESLLSMIKC